MNLIKHLQSIGANDSEKITDTMYSNRENLEAIFRMMDLDSNGLISMDEFKQACDLLTGKYVFIFTHLININ
jgi:Ca2+-binding EF-hand superfamily protein